ncbi:MAG: dTDP-glucose 4,6-dehydratase [Nitrospinota bacterium]
METWLVTGGLGFIGSRFVRRALADRQDVRIINLDKITYAGVPENLAEVEDHPRYEFHRGDIADADAVAPLVRRSDLIVNFAAETHVDRSIGDAADFLRTDVIGVYVLLEAMKDSGVRRLIQISTDEVYGEAAGGPSTERDALMPKSPYAASKAGGDRLAYSYWATHGTPVVITRCSNNYGPNQYPEKMLPLFITNALEDKPLPVYGDGLNTRDWIHVEDHVLALLALIDAEGVEGEVFNIGTGEERTVLQMAEAVLNCLNRPKDLIHRVRDRPGHVRRHAVSAEKLKAATGWSPRRALKSGVSGTVRWYETHTQWWRRIKEGEYREYYEKMYANR